MTVSRETLERIVALAEKATPVCGDPRNWDLLTLQWLKSKDGREGAELLQLSRNTAHELARTLLAVGKILGPDLERCNHANDIPLVISKDKARKLAELLGNERPVSSAVGWCSGARREIGSPVRIRSPRG